MSGMFSGLKNRLQSALPKRTDPIEEEKNQRMEERITLKRNGRQLERET